MDENISADASRIKALGGPTKVAELLGLNKRAGAVQRVHNWTVRGVPARIKLLRPDLFAQPALDLAGVATTTPQASHAG